MSNNELIKNEEITADGFERSLVIDVDTNHPRSVWRSDRSNGNSPNAGTYQKIKDGDIIIIVKIKPQSEVSVVLNFNHVVNGESLPVDAGFNFHPVINNITPLVREWLYDTISQPYLPKGIGWDGENPEIERIKMEKALSVLPKGIPSEHLDAIANAISFTSISVFNDVETKRIPKSNVIDIPDCNLCIQADKDNNVIAIDKPIYQLSKETVPLAVRNTTSKVYIIWYTNLKNNASKKIALEIIELI